MNIQLIALDLDGTTLQNDHLSISPKTQRVITAAIEKGILIVPTTGRLNSLLPQSIVNINGICYAITSNGAVTYDLRTGKMIYSNFMNREVIVELLDLIPMDKVLVELFKDGRLFVERKCLANLSEHPVPFMHLEFLKDIHVPVDSLREFIHENSDRIEKINLPYVPVELRNSLWRQLSSLDSISLTSSVPDNMEINDVKANKGAALQKLCNFLHIPAKNVMAIGDGGNDIEMLKFAGVSVAPENAVEEAKTAAMEITLANDEDGAALAIEKYALKN